MKLWPFPLLRTCGSDPAVSRLFLRMAADPTLRIAASDHYYLTVEGEAGKLQFWCANAYYAWAQDGVYTRPDGAVERWAHRMPSRYAVRKMREALSLAQFNPDRAEAKA